MGFVFYDVETTGIHRSFDQILQFAAIHTDAQLNELERFEIRCRLLPHVVPAPKAVCVTGVGIEDLTDPRLPSHYEMMCAIAARLREWSPAIFLGFNSIQFDEHLMRQAFYQNLHPAYLTNSHGNCRTDVLQLVQLVALYSPNALQIPTSSNGAPVFKLDQLAPLNGFNHSNAHDALADVEATIHLCRLIAGRAPDQWSNAIRFAQKAAVAAFMEEEELFWFSAYYFGRPYQYPVTRIGTVPGDANAVLLFDLTVDPDALRTMGADALVARLDRRPKPLRRVRINAAPGVMNLDDAEPLSATCPQEDELRRRATVVRTDMAFCQRLIDAFEAGQESRTPSDHVEEQLYDRFVSDADARLMNEFHDNPWSHRFEIVAKFEDGRLRELGNRLISQHDPRLVSEDVRQQQEALLAQRLLGHGLDEVPWLTLTEAINNIDGLIESSSANEKLLLRNLRAFCVRRLAELNRR